MKRVHLWSEESGAEVDVTLLRAAGLALGDFATRGKKYGRVLGDPVFNMITEGRAGWPGYYACGDLCHWYLHCLGVRDERLVNKDDDGGKKPWRVGRNLAMIAYGARYAWVTRRIALNRNALEGKPQSGDVVYVAERDSNRCVIPRTEHVCILGPRFADDESYVFEYGQVEPMSGKPAGSMNRRYFVDDGKKLILGNREILGWLDLRLLKYEESAIVPDDFTLGMLDDNPYYEDVEVFDE